MWGKQYKNSINIDVNNVHKSCFHFNRKIFLNYGFLPMSENTRLDRLFCTYVLIYKCIIIIIIIEEVKWLDKV